MEQKFENTKLDWCKNELKTLLERLNEGNYGVTAGVVFDHIAHTGVESDLNPSLKKSPTLEEFLSSN